MSDIKKQSSNMIFVTHGKTAENYGVKAINTKPYYLDSLLTLSAKGMLITLLSIPQEWNSSIKGYASVLPDSQYKINEATKELRKYGYLIIEKYPDGKNKWIVNEFVNIIEEEKPNHDNRDKGKKPDHDNRDEAPKSDPYHDNPDQDNRSQYIKDSFIKVKKLASSPDIKKSEKITEFDYKHAEEAGILPEVFKTMTDLFFKEHPKCFNLHYFWIWKEYQEDAIAKSKVIIDRNIQKIETSKRMEPYKTNDNKNLTYDEWAEENENNHIDFKDAFKNTKIRCGNEE